MMDPISDKARDLILGCEDLDQPGMWPGGESGVTIGIGYDLGFATPDQFRSDWGDCLSAADCEALTNVIGLKGADAKARAAALKAIVITRANADRVFMERSIPKAQQETAAAFPGVDKLPADAQGALVSLVYNRGGGMGQQGKPSWDSRREMRAIHDAVARGDLNEIAAQLRSMKRLWEGKGLDGLVKRRDAEADLVESCVVPPSY
jgi:GH24 family phage-related lysozyme (muramidase)